MLKIVKKILSNIVHYIIYYKKYIIAGISVSFAIALSISLYSFSPYDLSWFYYDSEVTSVGNLLGYFGANISALFFYLFGVASFLCVPFFLYLAYFLARPLQLSSEIERLLAFLLLPFVGAALFNIYYFDIFDAIYPGGVLGNGVKIIAVGWFDYVGALLFLYTMIIVCIVLVFRNTMTILLYSVARSVSFVSSKQKFLIPVYTGVAKTVRVLSMPFIFIFMFCKKLLCGEDVVGKDRSILEFENYIFDSGQEREFQELYSSRSDKIMSAQAISQEALRQAPVFAKASTGRQDDRELVFGENPLFSYEKKKKIKKAPAYNLPNLDLFDYYDQEKNNSASMDELKERAKILEEKLEMFGVFGKVVAIKRGPVITLFEYQPKADSKMSKIVALGDDLALALKALSIRIIAPIPGRSVVGFEVANASRQDVLFSSIARSKEFEKFSGAIPLVLGKDTIGNDVVVDLAKMPHLLIAGSTGSGKSVALNALLISMLYKLTPEELNLILIDPKRLEFSAYEDIGHLLFPIITDTKKVSPVLKWVVSHMEERYEKMAAVGARNIFDYNKKTGEKMSFIVIVIDELADLMMTAGKDVESLIARIAQMARAAGIHMIVATQRPSVDVITGLIKVNFPSRVSFRVTSKVDSRTILDCGGAEKLLGRGDMLFLGSGASCLTRLHGAYVSSLEIERVVNHIRLEKQPNYRDLSEYANHEETQLSDADDQLYSDVRDFLGGVDQVSISLLQRKFRIGYNRSARIIEKLESDGLILPSDGGKMRKVVR